MRIGIVCYPTFGGSGVVATELGKELAEKGHSVHFITYNQPVRLDLENPNVFYHEVNVSQYPLFDYPPYELVLTSKLVDVVTFEKLDILHVHYAIPHASAAYMAKQILASKGIDIPFVTTLHGTDITLVGKDASFEPVITFAINNSDAVTAVSQDLRRETFTHFGITREIEVIPNFICLDRHSQVTNPLVRERYAPNGERIIMHISNFRPVKRVQDIMQVFKRLNEVVPSKLLLIGDGPERSELEQLCRDLGTCGKVHFLGKVKNTEAVLAGADLFMLTSEKESFGLAALEAMASSVPVISTNTGGLPEVNVDGFSGYLHEVGDIEGMTASAVKLLSDQNLLDQFKSNALKQAEKFAIQQVLPMYEKLYKAVIEKTYHSAFPNSNA